MWRCSVAFGVDFDFPAMYCITSFMPYTGDHIPIQVRNSSQKPNRLWSRPPVNSDGLAFSRCSTIIIDAPIVEDDPDNQLRWKPQNYGMDFKGEVTLRNALVHSMNVPAIKTLDAVGVKKVIPWARKLGITTKINEDLSIALGSSCVTLWELTNVYALFNRYGARMKPTFIRRVVDRDGNLSAVDLGLIARASVANLLAAWFRFRCGGHPWSPVVVGGVRVVSVDY